MPSSGVPQAGEVTCLVQGRQGGTKEALTDARAKKDIIRFAASRAGFELASAVYFADGPGTTVVSIPQFPPGGGGQLR